MWSWLLTNLNWICPLFITIIFSGLNIVVAKCNIKIARQQGKMQNDAFCFQLSERRWEAYEGIDKILCATERDALVTDEYITQFYFVSRDVKFLFGQDMADFCEKTGKLLGELRVVGKQVKKNIDHQLTDPNHVALCDREAEMLINVSEQRKQLSAIVSRYISFSEYRIQK